MSLEAKKLNILQLIMNIDNEEIIDKIGSGIIQMMPSLEKSQEEAALLSKYAGNIEDKVDLKKIMKQQHYKGIDKAKMDMLIKKANIQEDIDKLLEMLD